MEKLPLQRLFTEEHLNVLMTALYRAAYVTEKDDNEEVNTKVYGFLQETPKTSLIAHLGEEIRGLGYKIVKV